MEILPDGRPRTSNLKGSMYAKLSVSTFNCQEFVPGKFRAKGRPGSVDFGLVAAKEISDHRGDAGEMNMQLALAAAGRRIYGHSDLVSEQFKEAPPLHTKSGGAPPLR